MGSTIALMLASLVSLSPAQAPPPDLPPPGAAGGPAMPPPGDPPPIREGLDISASYILWYLNKGGVPPLVTTSAPLDRGVLGAPSTQVLLGGTDFGPDPFAGGKFTASTYLTPVWDAEVGGFFLTQRRISFSDASFLNGPLLAIPTVSTATGQDSSIVIADPGVTAGSVTARLTSQLWGIHVVGVAHVACSDHWHLMLSTGVRYADFTESIRLSVQRESPLPSTFVGTTIPANSIYRGVDQFHARNQFVGALIGATAECCLGGFYIAGRAQLSGGVTHEQLNVHGDAFVTRPNGTTTADVPSNILAQQANIGGHQSDRGTVVAEAGVTLGYQLTNNIRLTAGYDFFYWDKVVRPGEQIDRRVNPDLVPFLGGTAPQVAVQTVRPAWMNLWAQGINVGVLLTY